MGAFRRLAILGNQVTKFDSNMIKSYNEVSVGMYTQLMKVVQEKKDEQERTIAILSILSGYSEEELLNMPYQKVERMSGVAGFLLTQPKPVEVRKVYNVGGFRLIPTRRRSRISTAQYISFQELSMKDAEQNFVPLLACCLIPEGKKFNEGYDIEDVWEAINDHLSIVDANAVYAFFLSMCDKLTTTTLNYLRAKIMLHISQTEEERKAITEALMTMRKFLHLIKNGDGQLSSITRMRLPEMLGA